MKNSIGQNIAYYRKKCGLTQEELSVKMNVTAQAVSKWENDLSYPDLACVNALAKVLDTTVNSLINGEEDLSGIAVSQNDDYKKKILVISLESKKKDHPGKLKLRLPLQLILEAKDHELMKSFLEGSGFDVEMLISAVKLGSVGPIMDLESDKGNVRMEVMDYDA